MKENIFYEKWHEEWKKEEIARRKKDLIKFYGKYFESEEEAGKFILDVYSKTTLENNGCLRMMNNIKRFATMMDEVKNKVELKLFFLIVCIESLYNLSDRCDLENKRTILKDFLENYLNGDEKKIIEKGMRHSIADDKYINNCRDFNLNEIADLFNELRNKLVHEGIYGYFSFGDGDCPMGNTINIYEGDEIKEARKKIKESGKKKVSRNDLDEYKKLEQYKREYDITITFEEVKNILIKGMIRVIDIK